VVLELPRGGLLLPENVWTPKYGRKEGAAAVAAMRQRLQREWGMELRFVLDLMCTKRERSVTLTGALRVKPET
jgi:hypothetical protein